MADERFRAGAVRDVAAGTLASGVGFFGFFGPGLVVGEVVQGAQDGAARGAGRVAQLVGILVGAFGVVQGGAGGALVLVGAFTRGVGRFGGFQ